MMNKTFIAILLSGLALSQPLYAAAPKKSQAPVTRQTEMGNKIDLNKADVTTLTNSIKGIGKKRAEAIVTYRQEHSGFQTIEELARVKGFGSHFVETHLKELNERFLVK